MDNKTMMNIFHNIVAVDCIRSMGSCDNCPFHKREYVEEEMAEYDKCLLVEVAKIILLNI